MRAGLLLLLISALASADTVYLKGGKKAHGKVTEAGDEVIVNIYNSTAKAMELGVQRFPKSKVKKIVYTLPAPHHEFQRRLLEIAKEARVDSLETYGGDEWDDGEPEKPKEPEASPLAKKCLELAKWCAEHKLKEQRIVALEMALRHDEDNATARKLLGSKAPKGSWSDQMDLAREYVAADAADARAKALAAIRKDRNFPFKELYLRRAWRSARQPTGYKKDRPVALRADRLKDNARYTIVVPKGYDPLAPTPLLIGLHGGGRGGADGKLVVGSGWQAMNFYRSGSEQRGWIAACPTALVGGWGAKVNGELVDALIAELGALYNVDENRIYLVGHSMGGGGTWAQGARTPERWAAIAPAASFGVQGINQFAKTKTGFYVYHSDNDPRCGVMGVRPRMENLPGSGIDFVYTELPNRGHSFPMEIVNDIFEFFAVRTLARRNKPQVRPLSSFLKKQSRDEKKYLPKLKKDGASSASRADEEPLKKLLKSLSTGGGVAEQVVDKLAKHSDPKTDSGVARIMLKGTSGPDTRGYAARILGMRAAKDEIKALGRMLLIETDSNALLEALGALGEINDTTAGHAILRFLKKRSKYLEERTQGGTISHSDWETILPTLTRACELVGTYAPEKGAATIASTVIEGVFLSESVVRFDVQNQRPQPYARALAGAACTALARVGGDPAIAVLKRMKKAGEGTSGPTVKKVYGPVSVIGEWPKDAAVAASVSEALETLGGG